MSNKQYLIDMNDCLSFDVQAKLGAALVNGNVGQFREALENGADPLRLDDHNWSVFDTALRTYGKAEFVYECLNYGCDPNFVNKHFQKSAISYASDSKDPEILKALLYYKGVEVNRKYSGLTPLNSLAKNLKPSNANDVSSCIKILLDYGACPNLADQREMTPLLYILKNKDLDESIKKDLIVKFLERNDLDLDTYRDGEAREVLTSKYPEFRLPEQKYNEENITFELLLRDLQYGEEEKFLQHYQDYQLNISEMDNQKNSYQEDNLALLLETIRRGQHTAFDDLLQKGVNINATYNDNSAVQIAASWGNHVALKKLLKMENLKIPTQDQLLILVLRKLEYTTYNDFCDYQKCFDLLLDSKLIDINETDPGGHSALHYAVFDRNTKAISELLKRGAYWGIRSAFGDLPLEGMSANILEEHFDSCITTNGFKGGDSNLEIVMDYKNFIPPSGERNSKIPPKYLNGEMAAIAYIADSKDHRRLLSHPLITSFLFLKWRHYSMIFYLNFSIYFMFALSFMFYIFLKFRASYYENATTIFLVLSRIGLVYLILREILQLFMTGWNYVKSFINWIEVALIILAALTCTEQTYDEDSQKFIAVVTLLLVSIELCLLVGSLPVLSISTHMLMLKEVSKTFLKSFALYSIFVITFSLSFYILFGKTRPDEASSGNDFNDTAGDPNNSPDGEKDEDEFNKFQNPLVALIKTIVMFTGEFDAGDLKFKTYYNYLIFLIFVIFMSIVLLNLLNGLAVSDTQAIKAQAELNGYICRANLLTRFENVVAGKQSFLVKLNTICPLRHGFVRCTPIQISVYPNDNNKVMMPITNTYEMTKRNPNNNVAVKLSPAAINGGYRTVASDTDYIESQKKLLHMSCCCPCLDGTCSVMDGQTVKMALRVIQKKIVANKEAQREQQLQRLLLEIKQELLNIQRK